MCYIFEKPGVQGHQKWYSEQSKIQIHRRSDNYVSPNLKLWAIDSLIDFCTVPPGLFYFIFQLLVQKHKISTIKGVSFTCGLVLLNWIILSIFWREVDVSLLSFFILEFGILIVFDNFDRPRTCCYGAVSAIVIY